MQLVVGDGHDIAPTLVGRCQRNRVRTMMNSPGLPFASRLDQLPETISLGVAAEVGENVRAGQPILMVEATGEQWLSFNVREDHLNGLAMGDTVSVMRNGAEGAIKSVITELQPLGVFATWQAERVIGDHDRNTLRLRLDPQGETAGLEPGMTVWIEP